MIDAGTWTPGRPATITTVPDRRLFPEADQALIDFAQRAKERASYSLLSELRTPDNASAIIPITYS